MVHQIIDLDEARHSPRVARKRQARIRQILGCALELARSEGRDALTLKRLAEKLDLTTPALYRYFASKDALVAELQRAVIATLAETTRTRVAASAEFAATASFSKGEQSLLGVAVSALVFEAFARSAPVEFGLLAMDLSVPEFTLPEREAADVFEAAWAALSDLAGCLEAAESCRALAPGDANERAVALWAGLQGVVQTRKLARSAANRIDPTRIAHNLVSALLTGWGAPAASANRVVQTTRHEGLAAWPDPTVDFFETD